MLKILLLALVLPVAGFAHEVHVGDLTITHPHIPQPPPIAKSAAGYLKIANAGAEDDRLIGIEITGIGMAMLHETKVDADGMTGMDMLTALDIPAGETVSLEPGAMHIMLTGLSAPLTEWEMLPATLVFEHAGRVAVEFMVEPKGDTSHDHD
ncbi:MAG: copper chaperone PCu(A)C [Deltaproteobacteria bacterium]